MSLVPFASLLTNMPKNELLQVINSQSVKVINQCFDHGTHEIVIKANNKDYFEVNTALYDLLLGAYSIETDQDEKTLTIMVDGGDYAGVWPMLMHGESINSIRLSNHSKSFICSLNLRLVRSQIFKVSICSSSSI